MIEMTVEGPGYSRVVAGAEVGRQGGGGGGESHAHKTTSMPLQGTR